jgi:solute carrier family 31 (copper transporter), member 1
MLFTWDTTDLCVVFRSWHVRGPWSLLFTLIGVVFLGMSYELLRLAARKYDESLVGSIRLGTPNHDDQDDPGRRPRSPLIAGGKYILRG